MAPSKNESTESDHKTDAFLGRELGLEVLVEDAIEGVTVNQTEPGGEGGKDKGPERKTFMEGKEKSRKVSLAGEDALRKNIQSLTEEKSIQRGDTDTGQRD